MTEEQEETDVDQSVPGPGDSKLAPQGNTDARLFIPEDQEERREESSPDEPEESPGEEQEEGDDAS